MARLVQCLCHFGVGIDLSPATTSVDISALQSIPTLLWPIDREVRLIAIHRGKKQFRPARLFSRKRIIRFGCDVAFRAGPTDCAGHVLTSHPRQETPMLQIPRFLRFVLSLDRRGALHYAQRAPKGAIMHLRTHSLMHSLTHLLRDHFKTGIAT